MIGRAARAFLALAWLWSGLALAQGAPALSPDDWREIRAVVEQQREALVAGDAERAFGFASRAIRAQFGDAESFLAMVQLAYAPLIEARQAVLLDGAVIAGDVIQPLRLILPDDTVVVALYAMEKQRGGWRIAGCVLAPAAPTGERIRSA